MKKRILPAILCFVLLMTSCGDKPNTDSKDNNQNPDTLQQEEQQSGQQQAQQGGNNTADTSGNSNTTSNGADRLNASGNANNGGQSTPSEGKTEVPPEQPAEETSLDRKIIMLLREQMSGQFDTGKMVFAFDRVEVVMGNQCRVYSMQLPGNTDPDAIVYFAVLADQSIIYQYDVTTKKFVQVYSTR